MRVMQGCCKYYRKYERYIDLRRDNIVCNSVNMREVRSAVPSLRAFNLTIRLSRSKSKRYVLHRAITAIYTTDLRVQLEREPRQISANVRLTTANGEREATRRDQRRFSGPREFARRVKHAVYAIPIGIAGWK